MPAEGSPTSQAPSPGSMAETFLLPGRWSWAQHAALCHAQPGCKGRFLLNCSIKLHSQPPPRLCPGTRHSTHTSTGFLAPLSPSLNHHGLRSPHPLSLSSIPAQGRGPPAPGLQRVCAELYPPAGISVPHPKPEGNWLAVWGHNELQQLPGFLGKAIMVVELRHCSVNTF